MTTQLSEEQFKQVLPAGVKKSVNPQLIAEINKVLTNDPVMAEAYRDNLVGFASVMKEGKFKMESYVNAVKYISHKLLGDTNILAYVKTFPDKYQNFVQSGVVPKDIASYISAYNKSKLVSLVYEQSLIPTHILNADVFQRAINVQASIMVDPDASFKVKSDAANSLLTHLKAPETKKIELDIAVTQGKAIDELREATMKLVETQEQQLKEGTVSIEEVAHSNIIAEAEFEEVT